MEGKVGEMEGELGEVRRCMGVSDAKIRETIPELSLQLKNAQSELVERHKEVMGLRSINFNEDLRSALRFSWTSHFSLMTDLVNLFH